MSSSLTTEKQLHDLSDKYDRIKQSAMEVNAIISSAGDRLVELKKQLLQEYETDDLDELVQLLEKWEEEDQKAVDDLDAALKNKENEVLMKQKAIKEIKGQ